MVVDLAVKFDYPTPVTDALLQVLEGEIDIVVIYTTCLKTLSDR